MAWHWNRLGSLGAVHAALLETLAMLDDRDFASLAPEDVEEVLAMLDRLAPGLALDKRDTFAFNVLVNALSTVIERIGQSEPGLGRTYVAAAQVMLDDA
jgi:hypothetical protein